LGEGELMATWDRYKNIETSGVELLNYSGGTFNPRSYCDDPTLGPVGIYTAKEPACKLKLTPVVQFANTNIAWDISMASSATSTISEFNIEWGGATDIGDLTTQDWSSDPKTGNVQFTTPGTYTVQAYVEDLLGARSKRCKTTVQIIDEFVNLQRAYIGTTDGGLYILTPDGVLAQSNTGLTGNHTNFRSVRLHPASKDWPVAIQHLWAATKDGVSYTIDGAANWNVISKATLGTPKNTAADDPAPGTNDLDQIDIAFDPQDASRVYLLRTKNSAPKRAWLYWTINYGATWQNEQVSV
jgi:hypothetical protein